MSAAPRENAPSGSEYDALEERLRFRFRDRSLLRTALTHRSHTPQVGLQNETLEFLGDALIGLVVAELLVRRWPGATEGQLSRRRAALVNAESLANKAGDIDLGPLILLGRGEEKTGGREKRSILAGAFEAVLGSAFLDGGFDAARAAVAHLFEHDVDAELGLDGGEYKTRLQELSQRLFQAAPEYTIRSVTGPDHARDFVSEVSIQGRVLGSGSGQSKKVAEQAAACEALEALRAEGRGESRDARDADADEGGDRQERS